MLKLADREAHIGWRAISEHFRVLAIDGKLEGAVVTGDVLNNNKAQARSILSDKINDFPLLVFR